MNHSYYCPVCLTPVNPTKRRKIAAHFDNAHRACQGGGEPFAITLKTKDAK